MYQLSECPQSTSIKVQSSISHTPEGTNTEGVRLIVVVRATIIEGGVVRIRSIKLRRRPIIGGGELITNGFISKL